MAFVVTVGSTVMCPHGGTVTLKSTQTKLTVGGQAVLLATDIMASAISGCTVVASTNTAPCLAVASLLMGMATKLTVSNQPVLLDSAQGLTTGIPPGTWSVKAAGHSKLGGV